MGWKWSDEKDDSGEFSESRSFSSSSMGFGGIGELGNPRQEGDRCSTRRIVKSHCKTEEIEPGKFVRRCEKTEQLLRDCVGRPVEVVESNTEYTEDDVTAEMARGSLPSSGHGPFDFPGLRSDIETLERNMFGGLSRFVDAAEEMRNGFFQAFGMPPTEHDRASLPSSRRRAVDGPFEKEAPRRRNESPYTEFSGQVRDV